MEQKQKCVSPMSNEGRNAYVVEHLTAALLELLREKPLADISVSELCGVAGVGRTSFYRNFESKEAILQERVRALFLSEIARGEEEDSLGPLILRVFSHLEAHRDFYGLLSQRGLIHLLKDVLLELCAFDARQEAPAAYASAFAAYSLYGWIEVWFLRETRETAEELAALLAGQGGGGGGAPVNRS